MRGKSCSELGRPLLPPLTKQTRRILSLSSLTSLRQNKHGSDLLEEDKAPMPEWHRLSGNILPVK